MTTDATMQEAPTAATAAGMSGLAQAIGARNLFIAIITMPIVFLLVVMAVIALFGKPGARTERIAESPRTETVLSQPAPLAATPAAPVAAFEPAPIILPSGEDVAAMAVDGDRLVLRVKGPSGGAIVVYDLATGATLKRIRILENPAGGEL
jgi:hypothetical protein